MANISALVNVQWFMGRYFSLNIDTQKSEHRVSSGIPFNDTSNFRLAIAEKGQTILGKYLAGLQVGNEPDLYAKHNRRPAVRATSL